MKVTRYFSPLTITLETEKDEQTLRGALELAKKTHSHIRDLEIRNFAPVRDLEIRNFVQVLLTALS